MLNFRIFPKILFCELGPSSSWFFLHLFRRRIFEDNWLDAQSRQFLKRYSVMYRLFLCADVAQQIKCLTAKHWC